MSDISAALGLVAIVAASTRSWKSAARSRRLYEKYVQSFEGIKPPYVGPDVTEVHWFLYVVHLGTRFDRNRAATPSSRNSRSNRWRRALLQAAAFAAPLFRRGWRRGDLLVTEKVADRAVALPFHCAPQPQEQIEFIMATMKDALGQCRQPAPPLLSGGVATNSKREEKWMDVASVTLAPSGTVVEANEGETLLSVILKAIPGFPHKCEGKAQCGSCHISCSRAARA